MTESITKEYNLEKDCELRFEIESKTQVVVEVSEKILTKKLFHEIAIKHFCSLNRDLQSSTGRS